MAISYPYPVAFLSDILPIRSVAWDIERNDELSGTGDRRIWQAEMASPLWKAQVELDKDFHAPMKQIAALIRKLHGAQEAFWLVDPLSPYPQADPDGSILGAATVQVHTVGADNSSLRLKGLPADYTLTLADKGQIVFLAGAYSYFFEVDETVTADGTGVTPEFEVFPHLPAGLAVDDPVTLAKPACKVFIMPGTHDPGTARRALTRGAAFNVMERPW